MSRDILSTIRELELNNGFTAWDANVDGDAPWPFRDRWHRFTQADGPDAHDHPFGIEVYVPRDGGGYREEIFDRDDRGWFSWFENRLPGTSFYIPATRVHRIDALFAPVVWTHVITGPGEQNWRVYPEAEIRNKS